MTQQPETATEPHSDVAALREAAGHAPRVLPDPLATAAARWLTAEADCHASADEVGQSAAALIDTLAGDPVDTTGFRVVVSTLPSAVEFARQVLALPTKPAADEVQWGVRFASGGVTRQTDEAAARAYAAWHREAPDAKPVEVVSRVISGWAEVTE